MMEHFIEISKAYDKRNSDPKKDYGIHGAEIRMLARGELGVVQFLIFSNRLLPHNTEELIKKHISSEFPDISNKDLQIIKEYSGDFTSGKELEEVVQFNKFINQLELGFIECLVKPYAADLGYHSPVPMYEGQEPMREIYKNLELIHLENGEIDFIPAVYGDPVICPYILSGKSICYYDGSGLNAKKVFDILTKQGIEKTWEYLDECYEKQFIESVK